MIIIEIKNKNNLRKFSHLQWVYIGSQKGFGVAESILKRPNRRFIAKDIERISDMVRDNFVNYIGMASTQQADMLFWYSSCMASKSTSESAMFNQYVYLKLLEDFLENEEEDILVATDDNRFIDAAARIFEERVRIFRKRTGFLDRIYIARNAYIRLVRYCGLWVFCRFFRNRRISSYNVIIHSWIDRRVFSRLPEYNDSYFGDLALALEKRGRRIGRMSPLWLHIRDILKLNRHYSNIIYPMAYLPLKDLVRTVFRRLKVFTDIEEVKPVRDIRILSILLKDEAARENNNKFFIDYLLLFCAYKSIGRILKKNSTLIYPFENQPWEKMFNMAFSKFNIIAYQHVPIPYNQLAYRVSDYEKHAPSPGLILTLGGKWTLFLKQYYPNTHIREAGAFRFLHMFKDSEHKSPAAERRDITVVLPISPDLAISLQKQLAGFLKHDKLSEYRIIIKPHPYLPEYANMSRLFSGYNNCEFTGNDIRSLLKTSILLITSGSGAAFESVSMRIKTLYFMPESLSLGVEYFIRDKMFVAHEEDFSEKLREALSSPVYPHLDIAEYFSEPDCNVFLDCVSNHAMQ